MADFRAIKSQYLSPGQLNFNERPLGATKESAEFDTTGFNTITGTVLYDRSAGTGNIDLTFLCYDATVDGAAGDPANGYTLYADNGSPTSGVYSPATLTIRRASGSADQSFTFSIPFKFQGKVRISVANPTNATTADLLTIALRLSAE